MPVTQATETFLFAPRALPVVVFEELSVDDVGESAFQRSDRLLLRLPFFELPLVQHPAFGAWLAELADGDEMQRMVEHPVASRVETMPFLPAGGDFDGRRRVVGRIMVSRPEPGHIAGVSDQQ